MKYFFIRSCVKLLPLIFLTSCSVGMAARTGGVKVENVTQCQTRQCFLSQDTAQILDTHSEDDGTLVETYKFQLKRGSAGRAAMHGLLDVATLGLWEVAGTPIEATKNKKYLVITARYRKDGSLISALLGGAPIPTVSDSKEELASENSDPQVIN